MGLDMYLNARKYVRNYAGFGDTAKAANLEARAHVNDILRIAGLGSLETPMDAEYPSISGLYLEIQVGYWRKANGILRWFEAAFGEMENCKDYNVSREQLAELMNNCKAALLTVVWGPETTDQWGNQSKSVVSFDQAFLTEKNLLPQAGFFYGPTDIDYYFFQDLEQTVEIVKRILDNKELSEETDFQFRAWW